MYWSFWYAVSILGSPYLWAGIAGGVFLVFLVMRLARPGSAKTKRLKRFLLILVPALVIGFLLTTSMKSALDFERICTPCPGMDCNPYCPSDASFPSGHAAAIFTGFSSAFLVLGEKRFLLLYIIPVLVGMSRMALGVHTWYDVAVGALIGIAVPVLVLKLDEKVFGKFK